MILIFSYVASLLSSGVQMLFKDRVARISFLSWFLNVLKECWTNMDLSSFAGAEQHKIVHSQRCGLDILPRDEVPVYDNMYCILLTRCV